MATGPHTIHVSDALADGELFARFVEGDDRAFTALYRRYSARVLHYVHMLLGSNSLAADDIFQEVFLRLFRERTRCARNAVTPLVNVGGWLFRVARNLSLNQIRSERFLTDLPADYSDPLVVTAEEAFESVFSEGSAEDALIAAVNRVVETLPGTLREVFVLREINGMSYEETAALAGCSPEAARMRMSRARSAIRTALRSFGVER